MVESNTKEFTVPGVAFTPPPRHMVEDARRAVDLLTKDLGPDRNGAVIAIATDAGVNAAIVHRRGDHFIVGAWIGKDWGTQINAGGLVRAAW